MSISIGSDYAQQLSSIKTSTSGDKLTSTLNNISTDSASDTELMEACQSFEEYLIEQVLKSTKEALCPDDDLSDNDYMQTFGDTLYEQYAKIVSENANLGIADMLYNSIKLNSGTTVEASEVEDIVVNPDVTTGTGEN